MSFARPAQTYKLAGIPLVPMIDLMFVLVIFFVTTTSFTAEEQQIDMNLPATQTGAADTAQPSEVIINVRADGQILIGARSYTLDAFDKLMRELVTDYPNERVIIRGDKLATYERIMTIVDHARAAGAKDVRFATVKKSTEVTN